MPAIDSFLRDLASAYNAAGPDVDPPLPILVTTPSACVIGALVGHRTYRAKGGLEPASSEHAFLIDVRIMPTPDPPYRDGRGPIVFPPRPETRSAPALAIPLTDVSSWGIWDEELSNGASHGGPSA
jgi:hypothetical protein